MRFKYIRAPVVDLPAMECNLPSCIAVMIGERSLGRSPGFGVIEEAGGVSVGRMEP